MSAAQNISTGKQVPQTPANTPASAPMPQLNKPANVPAAVEEADEDDADMPTIGSGQTREELMANPAFASLVQGRLAGLLGRSSGYVESLSVAVRNRVDGLQGIQVEQSKIEAEFQAEILELEKKYAKRYEPLYEKRARIVAGQEEPTDELVEAGRKADEDEEDEEDEDDDEEVEKTPRAKPTADDIASGPKGIPEFWLTALKNHLGISELITERDEEPLKFLADVRVSYLEAGKKGFKLDFDFAEGAQEFFSNKSLTKIYYYQDEVGYEGDLVYDRAEGTEIQWKEGKDLTHKVETKKQRNKNTNQTRIVKKLVPTDSFFTFFKPPTPPADDEEDEDEEDDELEGKLELDYQIGEDLKERIIPRAVDFFTGKALRYGDDLEELDSDEDMDDFDEDEDNDDDDSPRGARKIGGPRKAQAPPTGVTPTSSNDPQECKQS